MCFYAFSSSFRAYSVSMYNKPWRVWLPCMNLLNIWEFVCFVCGLSPPKRRVIRRRNFAQRRVQSMCRTSARFYVYRGRRYQKVTFFTKITCMHTVSLQPWQAVQATPRPVRDQGLIALLLIAHKAYGADGCLAACWAGVSRLSSLLLNDNQTVAAQRAATAWWQ